jgi:FixJ family two-component response regulator
MSVVSLIESNDSVSWRVAALIRSEGLAVEVFASAEEFILSDQMRRTACLVLDVQLPGMSGLQLKSHLAAAGSYIPTIFITTSADERARALALQVGALNVLDKASGDKALLKEICLTLKPRESHKERPRSEPSPEKNRP